VFHLHGLEDQEDIAPLNRLALGHLVAEERSGHRRPHLNGARPCLRRSGSGEGGAWRGSRLGSARRSGDCRPRTRYGRSAFADFLHGDIVALSIHGYLIALHAYSPRMSRSTWPQAGVLKSRCPKGAAAIAERVLEGRRPRIQKEPASIPLAADTAAAMTAASSPRPSGEPSFAREREFATDLFRAARPAREAMTTARTTIARTIKVCTLGSDLYGHVAVLAAGAALTLAQEHGERGGEAGPRLGRVDNIVHVAAPGRLVGVGELGLVLGDLLHAQGRRVRGLVDLALEYDVGGPVGSHHRDLGGRPGEDLVRAEVAAAHRNIRAAVGLAQYHCELGDRGLGVGVEDLGPVSDDPSVLLGHAWKV